MPLLIAVSAVGFVRRQWTSQQCTVANQIISRTKVWDRLALHLLSTQWKKGWLDQN